MSPADPNPQLEGQILEKESQKPTIIGKLIESLETKKALPVKVNIFNRFYAWASGKKTIAGIVLAGIGATLCLGPLGQVIAYKLLGESLLGIGSTILTGGIINKAQKINDPTAGQAIKTDWLSAIISILKKILELLSKIK